MCSAEYLPAKVLGKIVSASIRKYQCKLDVSKVVEKAVST